MRITLLGTGASAGVPLIGCTCAVCRSDNPKNRRLRASILVQHQGKTVLIDTSPDLRQQALAHNITAVDALFYTHAHADHTHGIDDVRSFNYLMDKEIPVYLHKETLESLTHSFGYVFHPRHPGWFRPSLRPELIEDGVPFAVGDMEVLPIAHTHGKMAALTFRFGDFAYSTDVNFFSEAALERLKGTKLWVVDCLRHTPSPTHAHLSLTLEWIARIKPQRAVLTHMSHAFDYTALTEQLPPGTEPGYDGMVLEL